MRKFLWTTIFSKRKVTIRKPVNTSKNYLRVTLLVFLSFVFVSCTNKGTKDNPAQLSEADCEKITGKAGFDEKRIHTKLYNGTAWTLTSVDVEITKFTKSKVSSYYQTNIDKRRFRLEMWEKKVEWPKDAKIPTTSKTKIYLIPFATGEFEGDVGDFLDGFTSDDKWDWTIISARGYKD